MDTDFHNLVSINDQATVTIINTVKLMLSIRLQVG